MSESGIPEKRPSWLGRNWIWAVPLGCLTPVLLCGGFIGVILVVVFGALKSVEPYSVSLERAQNHAAVKAALGEPIEAGYFVSGNVRMNGDNGRAILSIPISGPKGSGTIFVDAQKTAGKWTYATMKFAPANGAAHIELRTKSELKVKPEPHRKSAAL